MHRLEVPAGSRIRLSASAGAATQVRRWDVRMFSAGEPAPSSAPRLSYGSQIGGADGEQRIEIPPQDVDCRLEADASRRVGGVWEADQSQVTCDTPNLLELGFAASAASVGDDRSTLLSFHFYAPRRS